MRVGVMMPVSVLMVMIMVMTMIITMAMIVVVVMRGRIETYTFHMMVVAFLR
jgi:hypothetical protein